MPIPQDVMELIQGSGNNFHAKVARWFHDDGWHTTISPYYMDQTQGKAREIDLIVEKVWPFTDGWGSFQGEVVTRLFVECKFVATNSVFWFTEKDRLAAESLVTESGPYGRNNTYTNKHHYLSTCPKVAKVFASRSSNSPEHDPFYKALNQALNALVFMRDQDIFMPESHRRGGTTLVLDFPLIVCSSFDRLWGVDFLAEPNPQQISENFQLEVHYAYPDHSGTSRNDLFLLDFVQFSKLTDFVGAIKVDAETAGFFLSRD